MKEVELFECFTIFFSSPFFPWDMNDINEYIEKMKSTQHNLLNFLGNYDNIEEYYVNFTNLINEDQICNDKNNLKIILYLISSITQGKF